MATWYSIYSLRTRIHETLDTGTLDPKIVDPFLTPTIQEQALLFFGITIILYGLYKVVLFFATGKEIDEEAKINDFVEDRILIYDRKFSKETSILILFAIIAAFGLFLVHVVLLEKNINLF